MPMYRKRGMTRRKPVYRKKARTVKAIARAVVKREFRRQTELKSQDVSGTNLSLNDSITPGPYQALVIRPYDAPPTGAAIDERIGFKVNSKYFWINAMIRNITNVQMQVRFLHLERLDGIVPNAGLTGTLGNIFIEDTLTFSPQTAAGRAMTMPVDLKSYRVHHDKVYDLAFFEASTLTANMKRFTYKYKKAHTITYTGATAVSLTPSNGHFLLFFSLPAGNVNSAVSNPSVQVTFNQRHYYTDN